MRDTPGAQGMVRGTSGRAVAAAALRLACGRPPATDVDWPSLHALARRERLAPLAWIRSAELIAARADSATAAAWRRDWLGCSLRAYRLVAHAGELTALLEREGATITVLKGAPLGHRLYGDAAARPSTDLDVYAAPSARDAVSRAATALGWRHAEGTRAGDELFSRPSDDGEMFLEVHASLLGERLGFLPVPPPTSAVEEVDGVRLRAQAGPLLPSYLAAHLATHSLPPLLWWLDWWTLWSATDASARLEARLVARNAGLERYLAWAERRASAVDHALGGDSSALATLGVLRDGSRRDVHQLPRHVVLAPDRRAAVAAVREWVRPRWAATEDGGIVRGTLRRAARHWRLLLPRRHDGRTGVATAQAAPFRTMSGEEVVSVARAVVAAGGEMWLPVTGTSMTPTVAAGDSVLLVALRKEPRPGDIVFVAAGTAPLLHRVRERTANTVVTQGDACLTADPAIGPDAIVARAVAVRRGGVIAALVPTLRFGAMPLVRYLIRSARRPRLTASTEMALP